MSNEESKMKDDNKSIWDDLNIQQASTSEQVETGLAIAASNLGKLRRYLIGEGFTREESLHIVTQWMVTVLGQGQRKP